MAVFKTTHKHEKVNYNHFFYFFLSNLFSFTAKDIALIKSSKLIIGLPSNEVEAKAMKEAVNQLWKFTKPTEFLPEKEAKKKARKDKNTVVMFLHIYGTRSSKHENGNSNTYYRTHSTGLRLMITKGGNSPLAYQIVSSYQENSIGKETYMFGVGMLQDFCNIIDKEQLKSVWRVNPYIDNRNDELKTKILYINETNINKSLTHKEIEDLYSQPVKIVTLEEWTEAINHQTSGVAYLIHVKFAAGGSYVPLQYIVNAETGKCYSAGRG